MSDAFATEMGQLSLQELMDYDLWRHIAAGEGRAIAKPTPALPPLSRMGKLLNMYRDKDESVDLQIRPTMSDGRLGLKYLGVTYRKVLD